jgi:hypothetical protein
MEAVIYGVLCITEGAPTARRARAIATALQSERWGISAHD